ncbi:MAG TPA: hypothetical protein EYG03_29500 [Planctomycetes bacterium]|nr:hypothetical protein [Planctomycetota bacterium]
MAPADATDSEITDEAPDNDSHATTGQDGGTSVGADASAETLSQTGSEIFISVSLTDVPEAGQLNKDS